MPEMARNDRTAVERNGRGGARTYYRVVRAYSLRQVARSGERPVAILPRRGLSREMGRLRRFTRMRPLHRVLQGTAGGVSRWAWLGCEDCRAINAALEQMWGFRPLALGRHSLMNGIGVRGGAPPEVVEQHTAQLAAFARSRGGLRDWYHREYPRLAAEFDPLADIPLRVWQQKWPLAPRVRRRDFPISGTRAAVAAA